MHDIVGVGTGAEIADVQRVLLATFDIGTPCQQLLIGTDVERVDREEVPALCLEVLVEQDVGHRVGR